MRSDQTSQSPPAANDWHPLPSVQAVALARQAYIRRTCRVLDTPSIEAAQKDWNRLTPFERQREIELVYWFHRKLTKPDD